MAVKFNKGYGEIVCDSCQKIIISGIDLEKVPVSGEHMHKDCADRHLNLKRRLRKVA